LLGSLIQKHACRLRVADGRLLVDAEDEGEAERIGAVGEGFFELTVDAEPFQVRWQVACFWVISRWGLAVLGQRVRRRSSQSTRVW
jgi:hypothetical protein